MGDLGAATPCAAAQDLWPARHHFLRARYCFAAANVAAVPFTAAVSLIFAASNIAAVSGVSDLNLSIG